MKWKYKVGDKVKIKKRSYEAVGFDPKMNNYINIFTIVECKIGYEYKDPVYRIKKYDDCFSFVVNEWQIAPYIKMKI